MSERAPDCLLRVYRTTPQHDELLAVLPDLLAALRPTAPRRRALVEAIPVRDVAVISDALAVRPLALIAACSLVLAQG